MVKKPTKPETPDPLQEGLINFYSSQADLLLLQYENINQLLGGTSDWTHPGTHCEILLRDFLRKQLPQWMSVDKGYIYGRVPRGKGSTHCPEIDILIHNGTKYPPIFRLEDFVIVEPEAVLGIIQVKRSFTKVADSDPLDKGLKQVIDAKQHLFDMRFQQRPPNAVPLNMRDLTGLPFSALVSFDASDASLKDAIVARHQAHLNEGHYPGTEISQNLGLAVLPTVVGSLKGVCAIARITYPRREYSLFKSSYNEKNISVQLLLNNLVTCLQSVVPSEMKRFAWPEISSVERFAVPAN
jgi:hypothetical protein